MAVRDPTCRIQGDSLLLRHPKYRPQSGWDVLQPSDDGQRISVVHTSGERKKLSFARFRRECETGTMLPRSEKIWTEPKRNQFVDYTKQPRAKSRRLRRCPSCGADLTVSAHADATA